MRRCGPVSTRKLRTACREPKTTTPRARRALSSTTGPEAVSTLQIDGSISNGSGEHQRANRAIWNSGLMPALPTLASCARQPQRRSSSILRGLWCAWRRIRQSPKVCAMLIDSLDIESDRAQRLERMKREFLVAQQRRRVRTAEAVNGPDATDGGPIPTRPADGGPASIVPVADLARALSRQS